METDDERGRKTLALTDEGRQYVADHADELAAVWRALRRQAERRGDVASPASSRRSARSWARCGRSSPPARESQQRAAIDVLVETRRKLYGILADGDDADDETDEEAEDVMTDQTIRLSDAEREAAAADLGEHFAQGRLTADEHAERLEQVWGAKTRGEIAPIFRDLPSPYAAVASAPSVAAATTATGLGPAPVSPRGSGPAPGGAGRADRGSPRSRTCRSSCSASRSSGSWCCGTAARAAR